MNMPIPFSIENLVKSSVSPSGVQYTNNAAFGFYCRYLWQKLVNVFTYDLPEDWAADTVQAALFGNGCMAVVPSYCQQAAANTDRKTAYHRPGLCCRPYSSGLDWSHRSDLHLCH